jgi:hypothetical protein
MEATMDDNFRITEDATIIRYTQDSKGRHKVGAPAEVIESATFKKVLYAQNDKPHRPNGPAEYLLHKPTNTVVEEVWWQKGKINRSSGLPFETNRNLAGEITSQASDLGYVTQGPWHIDPDCTAITDKPRAAVDYETECHYRCTVDIVGGRFYDSNARYAHKLHREGNLPAETERFPSSITQGFFIDGQPGRTDGGPTFIRTSERDPIVEQKWEAPLPLNQYGRIESGLHREDGPARIILGESGTIEEEWFREGKPYTPTGHDLMRWARLKAEQGGPLWVPPEQRHPDGPKGPSQVLIHPETGVRFYEAHNDILGRLDRADGPAQVIRDQKTGQTLREAYHKEGLIHREGGPSLTVFDPETGAVAGRYWHLEGKLNNPEGPAIITETRHHNDRKTYTGFADEKGEILHAKTIDHQTGVVLEELDRRNNGTKAPTQTWRGYDGSTREQEWCDTQDRPHRDGAPAIVKAPRNWTSDPILKWVRQGSPYEPTPEDNIRWAALQREQGGIFWQPPSPEQDNQARPGGVKAAAAAAAAKAAEPKTSQATTADRGDAR